MAAHGGIYIQPPNPLDFSAPQNWEEWKKRFDRYRIACKLDKEDGEIQVNTLLYTMGPESEHIFAQFALTEAESKSYATVADKFKEHFTPKRNVIHERAMFHQRNQRQGETVEAYIRALYELAERCDFGAAKNDSIRDRLVVGTSDRDASRRMQLRNKLTLNEALDFVRQCEAVKAQIQSQSDNPKAMEEVRAQAKPSRRSRHPQKKPDSARPFHKENNSDECGRCGGKHGQNCPAKKARCHKCRKIGHYGRCCRTREVK